VAQDPIFPLLDDETAGAAAREAGLPEIFSRVNLFRTTLHHPPIARIMGDAVDALVLNSVLDARRREIAILRVGWRIGSVYEWSNHYPIARRAGLSDEEIVAVRGDAASTVFGPADHCVIKVVDEVLDHVVVSPATLAEARILIGDDRALMELLAIPGCYRAIGTLLLTLEVPLEDHVKPWAPDGAEPDHHQES